MSVLGGDLIVDNHGWLEVHPEQLDRFARDLDELIETLERVRSLAADAAVFPSPSMDPASLRATRELANDGHNLPGTPVHAIGVVIDDLRKQVMAARLAARDYRATEAAAAERIRRSGESAR